jgi:hypothetical protein
VANWYATREQVKRALRLTGSDRDLLIDRHIDATSEHIREILHRRFIPLTAERKYDWPQRDGRVYSLHLDEDLLAVTALTKTGTTENAIAAADYFLEDRNLGPPYWRIDIDLASTNYFEAASDTPQNAIHVTGRWAYSELTEAAGTVASGLGASASATSGVCSDASLIDVGDTLLIESEQLFVTAKATADTGTNTNGALTADATETTVTVGDGTAVKAGEVILINSEKMLVDSVAGNDCVVQRAYDGTALAAHSDAQDVYAYRTLTLERGVNGTTAATHADTTAISVYVPPADVLAFCIAKAVYDYQMEQGGWTGQLGGGEATVEARGTLIAQKEKALIAKYRRGARGAV